MKYYPSTLVLTKEHPSIDLIIEEPGIQHVEAKNIRLVVIKQSGEQLQVNECASVPLSSFSSIKYETNKLTLTVHVNDLVSAKLNACFTEKNQSLAIRITLPGVDNKKVISNQQGALIPLFDATKQNMLTQERTGTILGELQSNLRLANFTCNQQLLFTNNDILCSGEVLNTTDSPVVSSIITYARELLPPAYTRYENLERTNLLLLPGQSYAFTVSVPKDKLTTPGTNIAVVSTFAALGDDSTSFTASAGQTIYLIPPLFVGILVSSLLVISAILYRIKRYKFSKSPDGPSSKEKSNDSKSQ